MKPYIAFHDGEVFIELENWLDSKHVPAGAFIRYANFEGTVSWYVVYAKYGGSNACGISESDIPPWVRGYLLIL